MCCVPYVENSAVAMPRRVGTQRKAEGSDDSITDSRSEFDSMVAEDEAVDAAVADDELLDLAFAGADEMELDEVGGLLRMINLPTLTFLPVIRAYVSGLLRTSTRPKLNLPFLRVSV
jgi:hypothetical protein